MKKMRRLTGILLIAVLVLSLVGCSKGKGKDKDVVASNGGKPVEISYWNSGMGTDYLDAMVKAFNEKQSEWFVYYTASADNSAVTTAFGLEDVDTIDLYMATKKMDTSKMATLDDVLDATVDGENKSLKEKFDESYLQYEVASDNHYYTLSWGGGAIGIVYNQKLFEQAGIKQSPRTTDELAVVCDQLLSEGITPFTHFRGSEGTGYWEYLQDLWYAQYEGWDYFYNNYYGCTDENGKSPSKDVLLKKDGRYQVLSAMEGFVTPEYVQAGANSQDHITAQTLFLNQNIGMMVSGSWLANEMKGTGSTEDFGVMKTPVISGIIDKLTTVKNDMELRALVSAIDAVADGTDDINTYKSGDGYLVNNKQVSAADWEYVSNARNAVAANYPKHSCFIPRYSDAIDGAKEFLKFFYSDEGYKIYTDTLHVTLPMSLSEGEVSTEGWSSFEMDMCNIFSQSETLINDGMMSKHPIYVNGGADPYAYYTFVEYFCSNNTGDRVSADEAWTEITRLMEGNYDKWLGNME